MVSTVTLTRCKNSAIFNQIYAETARHMYYMEIGNGHFFQKLSLSYNFSAFQKSIFNDFRFEHQSLLIFSWEHISEHRTVVNSMRYLCCRVHCVYQCASKFSTTVLSVLELFVSKVKRILTQNMFSRRNLTKIVLRMNSKIFEIKVGKLLMQYHIIFMFSWKKFSHI